MRWNTAYKLYENTAYKLYENTAYKLCYIKQYRWQFFIFSVFVHELSFQRLPFWAFLGDLGLPCAPQLQLVWHFGRHYAPFRETISKIRTHIIRAFWYCMVLVWYCMILHGFYGIVWYCRILHGIAWYCIVFYCAPFTRLEPALCALFGHRP